MKKILIKKAPGIRHSVASDRKVKDVKGLVLKGSCSWSWKLHSLQEFKVSFGCTKCCRHRLWSKHLVPMSASTRAILTNVVQPQSMSLKKDEKHNSVAPNWYLFLNFHYIFLTSKLLKAQHEKYFEHQIDTDTFMWHN